MVKRIALVPVGSTKNASISCGREVEIFNFTRSFVLVVTTAPLGAPEITSGWDKPTLSPFGIFNPTFAEFERNWLLVPPDELAARPTVLPKQIVELDGKSVTTGVGFTLTEMALNVAVQPAELVTSTVTDTLPVSEAVL